MDTCMFRRVKGERRARRGLTGEYSWRPSERIRDEEILVGPHRFARPRVYANPAITVRKTLRPNCTSCTPPPYESTASLLTTARLPSRLGHGQLE